ncbi:MAG: hypothetical protein KDC44_14625 [Phaeodactylibacter sp.]|nr:hypothetical protein [Phaeodactylibacter sp.]
MNSLWFLQVDTTSIQYQVGYQIGSYLPVIIILILAILVMIRASRRSRKD